MIDRGEPQRRVRQDRKKRHQKGADQHGARWRKIDQQQRRDGDDGRHLKHDRVGRQCARQPFGLRHRQGQQRAANRRQRQRPKRDRQGDEQRRKQQFAILDQLLQDNARRRQHVGGDAPQPNNRLPQRQKSHEGGERGRRRRQHFAPIQSRRAHGSSSPMARRRAFEARRESCENTGPRRYSPSRVMPGSTGIWSTISPPLAASTTIRVER